MRTLDDLKIASRKDDEREDNKTVRNVLMAGAAAVPWAKHVNKPNYVHQGKGVEFSSLEELQRNLRPGDALLSSPHKKDLNTLMITMGTGTPDVTHASFVDDRGRLVTVLPNSPEGVGTVFEKLEPGRAYTVMRPKADRLNAADLARKYREHHELGQKLVELGRASGLAPEQVQKQLYQPFGEFIRTAWRETAQPEGHHLAGAEAKRRYEALKKNPSLDSIHACAGGWCSAVGAYAMPEHLDVVPGRAPHQVSPADYLASDHFEAVGGLNRGRTRAVERAMAASPAASRLLISALGAGGVYGADAALSKLKKSRRQKRKEKREAEAGLARQKVAREDPDDPEAYQNQRHIGRNLLMAGAAGAPWIGAIGEHKQRARPVTHTTRQLLDLVQDGDIMLLADKDPGFAKTWISFASGSPEAYHVSAMVPGGREIDASDPGGFMRTMRNTEEELRGKHVTLLRPKLTPEQRQQYIDNLNNAVLAHREYVAAAGEMLKERGYGDQLRENILGELENSAYGKSGPEYLGREMFKPKTVTAPEIDARLKKIHDTRKSFAADPRGHAKAFVDALEASKYYESDAYKKKVQFADTYGPKMSQSVRDMFVRPHRPPEEVLRAGTPNCYRGVCSTLPATALPEGVHVVPGKHVDELLPSDWMRSRNMDFIGASSPDGKLAPHEHVLRQALPAWRLATGAGGAAAVYGLDRARHALTRKLKAYRAKKKLEQESKVLPARSEQLEPAI